VDFSGSPLEEVDVFHVARKKRSHIHDYLGKRISIISLINVSYPHFQNVDGSLTPDSEGTYSQIWS
jgi:hypothetical protein